MDILVGVYRLVKFVDAKNDEAQEVAGDIFVESVEDAYPAPGEVLAEVSKEYGYSRSQAAKIYRFALREEYVKDYRLPNGATIVALEVRGIKLSSKFFGIPTRLINDWLEEHSALAKLAYSGAFGLVAVGAYEIIKFFASFV